MEMQSWLELEVTVSYDVQPYEAQTRTDPEVLGDIENISVAFRGADITNQLGYEVIETVIKKHCIENETEKAEDNR